MPPRSSPRRESDQSRMRDCKVPARMTRMTRSRSASFLALRMARSAINTRAIVRPCSSISDFRYTRAVHPTRARGARMHRNSPTRVSLSKIRPAIRPRWVSSFRVRAEVEALSGILRCPRCAITRKAARIQPVQSWPESPREAARVQENSRETRNTRRKTPG